MPEQLGAAELRIDVNLEALQAQLDAARRLVERQKPFSFQLDTSITSQQFRQLDASAKTLEAQFKRLLSTPLNLNSSGLRKLGADAVTAGLQINDFTRAVVNGDKALATSLASLQQQGAAFRTLAANVKVGTAEYTNFTQAAIKAEQKQLLAGFTGIEAAQKLYAGGSSSFVDVFKGTEQLLEFGKRVKDSPAAIKLYVQALQQAADVTSVTDTRFARLNAEIERQTNALDRARQAAQRYNSIYGLSNAPKALPPGRGPSQYVFTDEETPEERRARERVERRRNKINSVLEAQASVPTASAGFSTLSKDTERLQQLEFRLNNAQKGSAEYDKVLRLLTATQNRFASAVERSSTALDAQKGASGGFSAFSQSIEENISISKAVRRNRERVEKEREASSRAVIRSLEEGSAAAEQTLKLIQARREATNRLAAAQEATAASMESGFAAFSRTIGGDAITKSIARNRRKKEQQAAREQEALDIIENDLALVREERTRQEKRAQAEAEARTKEAAAASKARQSRQERIGSVLSNSLIGGAFPALFGQGIGASLGGAAGGGLGGLAGGQFGFGLSLIGTAVGAQFDEALNKLKTLGAALSDPIGQFDALRQASLLSSKGLERQAEGLIRVGRDAEAAALIQADLFARFGDTSAFKNLNTAFDDLSRTVSQLTVSTVSFVAGPLTDFLTKINASLTVPREQQLQNKRTAEYVTAQALNPLQRSLGVTTQLEFRGKRYTGNATDISQAIQSDLNNRALEALRRGTEAKAAAVSAPAQQKAQELQLVAAQAQGYQKLTLERQKELSIAKELQDIDNLKARNATAAEIDERRTQGLRERVALQEQLNELDRKATIQQETRPGIQQQSLALINAQTSGMQRQAIVEEQRLEALKTQQQLLLEGNRDPVRRAEIQDQGALTQARLAAQLTRLDKERAAAIRQVTFDSEQQAQATQRQLSLARQRLTTEAGISRQTLEQRQSVQQSIAAAFEQQKRARFSFVQALREGGDAGQQRAFEVASKDLPEAARQIQLSLLNGALALKDAGREIGRSIDENARALQNLYLTSPFAAPEQRGRAGADLERRVQAEAERRGVRFTLIGGTEEQRTSAKLAFLDFGRQETQLLQQSRQLSEALATATKPIIDSNLGLIGSQGVLADALVALSQKDWNVNVAVASDGTVTPSGDIVTGLL